jgi:hypothetical protein
VVCAAIQLRGCRCIQQFRSLAFRPIHRTREPGKGGSGLILGLYFYFVFEIGCSIPDGICSKIFNHDRRRRVNGRVAEKALK